VLRPSGPANLAPADLTVALAIGACALWFTAARRVLRFPYAAGITLFLIGGALGGIAGPVPGKAVLALIQDVVLIVWCWAVVNVCGDSVRRLRVLLGTWAYSSVAWATLLMLGVVARQHWLTGQTLAEGSRTSLTLGDPNFAANYFFVGMMVVWAVGRPRHRLWRLLSYGVLLTAIGSTGSNSGMVAIIVGVTVAVVAGLQYRRGTIAATAAFACIAVAGVIVLPHVHLRDLQQKAHGSSVAFIRDGFGHSSESVYSRSRLLHQSAGLYRDGGILGAGPASTKVRLRHEQAPYVKEAHDDYFAALIERGAIGLAGLLLLVASVAWRMASALRARRRGGEFGPILHPHAIAGAVAGTLVGASTVELLHVRHVWALFAVVAAIPLGRRSS
jgi:O-antigen ligase